MLAHPFKLKALTAGWAKNDKNDAEMLAELRTAEYDDLDRRD